jgi:hypothetical protein
LREANLHGARLDSADLQNALLARANLNATILLSANLQHAVLAGSNAQDAVLGAAKLQGADLGFAKLQGADLQQADLRGANLQNADLKGADLEHANLQGADLANADLRGASLFTANLQAAILRGAKLQGADLKLARLWLASLDDDPTRYRFADVRGIDLHPPKADEMASWLAEAEQIADRQTRQRVFGILKLLQEYSAQAQEGARWQPAFPADLAQQEDVLFDPVPPPAFADFDPQFAAFLIDLACNPDASPGVAHTAAARALHEQEEGRLFPRLVAKALLSDGCSRAAELPDEVLKRLKKLEASNS